MKVSQQKHKLWIYLVLVLSILSLLLFSILPLITGIISFQDSQETTVLEETTDEIVTQEAQFENLKKEANGYQLFLNSHPDNQIALRKILLIRLQLQDYLGAMNPLEKLIELNPDSIDYTLLFAQLKQELGEDTVALKIYQNILTKNPENIQAIDKLVNLLLAKNLGESAREVVENALNLDSDSIDKNALQSLLVKILAQEE